MAKTGVQRWGRRYGYRRQQKIDFVNDVKGRLENDVGPYFDAIADVYSQTGRGVGFWALPRMLFPVIEAVATTVFRSRSKAGAPAVRLLRRLGVPCPALTWEMYRNVLMHGDEPVPASYRGYSVQWAISIGDSHRSDNGELRIDVKKLYDDLRRYLEDEANETANAGSTVWVKERFKFVTGKRLQQAKRDILAIGRR